MADGRMIRRDIAKDIKMKRLQSDTHRMLFCMTIPHLDREGRMSGDPEEYIATVAPILRHLDVEEADEAMADFERVGLAMRYTDEHGYRVLAFPNFPRHQRIRKDREAESKFGDPPEESRSPPGGLRDDSGSTPGVDPSNRNDSTPGDSGSGPGVVREDSRLSEVKSKGREENPNARAREDFSPPKQPDPKRDPMAAQLQGNAPGQRKDVQQLYETWKHAVGLPHSRLRGGFDHDAVILAEVIDTHGLEDCLRVAKHAPNDGKVSGKTDERGEKHPSVDYIFGIKRSFDRILHAARERDRTVSKRKSIRQAYEEAASK